MSDNQRTFHFTLSDKGGAGKTFVTDKLVDTLRNRGKPTDSRAAHAEMARRKVAVFDLDAVNLSLASVHGIYTNGHYDLAANMAATVESEFPSGCPVVDARDEQKLGDLFNLLADPNFDFDDAVVDLPGGDQKEFDALTGSLRDLTQGLIDLGFRIVLNYVIDHDPASSAGIAPTLCAWGAGPVLRVMKNFHDQKMISEPFRWYEGELGAGAKPVEIVRLVEGVELAVPHLHWGKKFREQQTASHQPLSQLALSFTERQQRLTFTRQFEAALAASDRELATRSGITPEQIEAVEAMLRKAAA
ncbi:hypothetical protein LA345_12985 [Burkholderia vietnamiensis]|uniref:CobQ/CobB/MinD/ParA nucleotide binding domain-containing protein n=1 Tax=Burkholderia vietnamiensis (strain G4 / LMG 22486) TaxID=269482 RepID=A4JFL3_BURVG|nr:hypothetical protein Bcep1808_2064 [Burkholderia vietnamiensis G4]MCB4344827.1 hypothetical protein [Burkholderia vietnamiensis]